MMFINSIIPPYFLVFKKNFFSVFSGMPVIILGSMFKEVKKVVTAFHDHSAAIDLCK